MELERRLFMSIMDFSNANNGLETLSTIVMCINMSILAYKTLMNFMIMDYVILFFMGIWYYSTKENYHVVPQHQVPAKMHIKNGKKGQFNDPKNYLVNSAEQKQEDYSRTIPLQQERSPEKLLEETESNGIEYTPAYLDLCKHFEDEDHATCQKKVDLACKLIDYGFCTDRAIDAAKNCDNFSTAAAYLSQKCDSCNKDFSLPEIIPMLMCTHKFCKSCTKIHFTEVITEKNILKCTCKICEMPNLECEEKAIDYFSSLGKDLKIVLSNDIYQIFKQILESGRWKTELKSKLSDQHGKSEDSKIVSLVKSIVGVETRSAARASQHSSNTNVKTTQIFNVRDQNDTFPETTCSAVSLPNHLTAKKVTLTDMVATDTTAGNYISWPQTETTLKNISIDQSRVENYYSNSCTMESCSFCLERRLTYKMITCEDRLCLPCVSVSLSEIIREKDIIDCVCPICHKPEEHELQSKDAFFKYFESFRKSFSGILNKEVQQILEMKFKNYVENTFGEDDCCTKTYSIESNEQENCNEIQTSCDHKLTPGNPSVKLLCEHSRCVECVKEIISSENIIELVCEICYPGDRDAKLKVLNYDSGINLILRGAVGPAFYQIFTNCLDTIIAEKVPASKFSTVNSSRNSVNDYVEQKQVACPTCGNRCNVNRLPNTPVRCNACYTSFCETCKACYFNKKCEKRCFTKKGVHLHHKDICVEKSKRIGYETLESILKSNRVDFVNVQSGSFACKLREVYDCKRKQFKSELCRYHYEDYLASLILLNRLHRS